MSASVRVYPDVEMASSTCGRDGKMRSGDGNTSETDMLLHPELLSQDFIKLVLHERKIKTEDEDHDQLTDLYIQHVIPLPQRELPNSRWGKRMEKTNPRKSLPSTLSSNADSGRKRPLIVFDGQSTKTPSVKVKRSDDLVTTATDRLKPPPSSINLSNPVRKLSGSSTNPSQTSASAAQCSGRSPTGNGSLSSSSTESSTNSISMSTKLKRVAPNPGVPASNELKSPEVKRKIQHVTWP